MSTKKWRLCLTSLSSATPLRELDVEASNWMGALRESRKLLGEDGGMPPGASCAVAENGTVTILDGAARRKFVLTPASAPAAPAPQPTAAQAPSPTATPAKKKKFETVAFSAAEAKAMMPSPQALAAPAATPAPAPQTPPARVETPAQAPAAVSGTTLVLLLQRDEEPTKENPLTYRERAYAMPTSMRVSDAEAALRAALTEIQAQIQSAPRGRFVTLAAFDHHWTDTPSRPPLVVLQWRDWRGEPVVDYPAAIRMASLPPGNANDVDERMAIVFEALQDLAHKKAAVEALELVLGALQQTVPSAAMSGCLYDINTDQLRFVVLTGHAARERQGQAISRNAGLIGQAARAEQTLVIPDLRAQPMYVANTDGRPGLDATSMLLRAVMHDGQLLGVLQLIDRYDGAFTAGDVHIVNYAAERLGELLHAVRARPTR